MIAHCRAKMTVIQLTESRVGCTNLLSQKGLKGNVVIFPQDVSSVARTLPPSLDDLIAPMCIIFVGSSKPSNSWLLTKAKPLTIRPQVVTKALEWLKINNILYNDVDIDYDLLRSLPPESRLNVPIHRYEGVESIDSLTARYDNTSEEAQASSVSEEEVVFERVCVPDAIDVSSPDALRAAAATHLKEGGSYVQVPHGPSPCNEFKDPDLLPMVYPTLFPYGLGGFEHQARSVRLSMEWQIQ
ncbi:hypothetical protein BJ165DRAFT_1317988, partial [Panaeolus papilionaceus]